MRKRVREVRQGTGKRGGETRGAERVEDHRQLEETAAANGGTAAAIASSLVALLLGFFRAFGAEDVGVYMGPTYPEESQQNRANLGNNSVRVSVSSCSTRRRRR